MREFHRVGARVENVRAFGYAQKPLFACGGNYFVRVLSRRDRTFDFGRELIEKFREVLAPVRAAENEDGIAVHTFRRGNGGKYVGGLAVVEDGHTPHFPARFPSEIGTFEGVQRGSYRIKTYSFSAATATAASRSSLSLPLKSRSSASATGIPL